MSTYSSYRRISQFVENTLKAGASKVFPGDKYKPKRAGKDCQICQNKVDGEYFEETINTCKLCLLYERMSILDESDMMFSQDHFGHVVASLMPSPITWIWIAAMGESLRYMMTMLVVSGIFFLVTWPMFKLKIKRNGPFEIASKDDLSWMHIIQYVVNLILFGELLHQSLWNKYNVVYKCHWQHFDEGSDGPPDKCLLYLDLLGNSLIVYFCSFFVNMACIRTVKMEDCGQNECPACSLSKNGNGADDDFLKLPCPKPRRSTDRWKNGMYVTQSDKLGTMREEYKCDDIEEFDPNEKLERGDALSNDEKRRIIALSVDKALRDLHLLGTLPVQSIGFSGRWFVLHCTSKARESPYDRLKNESSQFIADLLLFLSVWTFSIGFAVSSFITYGTNFNRALTEGTLWEAALCLAILTSFGTAFVVHTFCTTLFNVTQILFKASAAMRICETSKYLLYNKEIPEIQSVKAWYDLRCYVVKEVLPLYNELTQPIISLLVIGVFGFTAVWMYQLLDVFEGNPADFFQSIMADNVRFVLFGFTVFLVVATMMVLNKVLQPYSRQSEHIAILKAKKTELMFKYKAESVATVKNVALDKVRSGQLKIPKPNRKWEQNTVFTMEGAKGQQFLTAKGQPFDGQRELAELPTMMTQSKLNAPFFEDFKWKLVAKGQNWNIRSVKKGNVHLETDGKYPILVVKDSLEVPVGPQFTGWQLKTMGKKTALLTFYDGRTLYLCQDSKSMRKCTVRQGDPSKNDMLLWTLARDGPVDPDIDLNLVASDDMDDDSEYVRGDLSKAISGTMRKYESFIELYDHLIEDMSQFASAPVIMGMMELNETKLAAIRGYLLSVVVLFLGTIFGNYVQDIDSLLSN